MRMGIGCGCCRPTADDADGTDETAVAAAADADETAAVDDDDATQLLLPIFFGAGEFARIFAEFLLADELLPTLKSRFSEYFLPTLLLLLLPRESTDEVSLDSRFCNSVSAASLAASFVAVAAGEADEAASDEATAPPDAK